MKTTLERIMDCFESLLNQITQANGFRTDGMLVDRDRDPRYVRDNKPERYRQCHAALTLNLGKRSKDPLVTSGRTRWHQELTILGLRTMTKDQDKDRRTLDGLVADLQSDVEKAIREDRQLLRASLRLGMEKPPVITHPEVIEWANDEGANFPDAHFIGRVRFMYDEWF